MYKLYNIEGINVIDTPIFTNKQSQFSWFNDRQNLFLDIDAYYPPQYNDKITFDIEDINFNSQVNYLSLEYQGKDYYYFITNIEYVTEDTINLYIQLDVIQTFMFDINFRSGMIERLTINRWDNGIINRDYIRENLSQRDFTNKNFNYTNNLAQFILIRASQNIGATTSPSLVYGIDNMQNKILIDNGCYYYLIPYPFNEGNTYSNYKKLKFNDGSEEYYNDYYNNLHNLMRDPRIISMEYIRNENFNSLINITFDNNQMVVDTTYDSNLQYYISKENYNPVDNSITSSKLLKINRITLKRINKYASDVFNNFPTFTTNTLINNIKNIKYCPYLLDDNYYRLYYGEYLSYTTFPLHKINTNISGLFCSSTYDIISGNRSYKMLETHTYDIYFTTKVNNSVETLSLYTDPYQQYVATNKGTLTTGVALQRTNALYNLGKGVVAPLTKGINTTNITKSTFNSVDSAMGWYNYIKQLEIKQENYDFSPDNLKYGNSFSNDILNNLISEISFYQEVEDINQVMEIYERYGLLVQDYNVNSNFYNYINKRYYYNYVKTNNLSININNGIDTSNFRNLIIDRFNNGIRFWNVENNGVDIGIYQYDNVENENL